MKKSKNLEETVHISTELSLREHIVFRAVASLERITLAKLIRKSLIYFKEHEYPTLTLEVRKGVND